MAKIMARILSKHAASSRLEVIHYESARGFDEGHVWHAVLGVVDGERDSQG
jgi:hypothetical protein